MQSWQDPITAANGARPDDSLSTAAARRHAWGFVGEQANSHVCKADGCATAAKQQAIGQAAQSISAQFKGM